jgi:flagellar basal-body rod modification protein FlgD
MSHKIERTKMETSAIGNGGALTSNTAAQQSITGKEQFLQLLVTQLKHQDPLSPLESQEFASQLAQFSNVELLGSIDSNIANGADTNIALAQSITNTMAAAFIGKEVTVVGDSIHLGTEAPATIDFRLGQAAEEVRVKIYDENDVLVREIDAGSLEAGLEKLKWDGLDKEGGSLTPGKYRYEVSAFDADKNPVEIMQMAKGYVEAVKYAGGAAVLVVNGKEVLLADVLQVGAV